MVACRHAASVLAYNSRLPEHTSPFPSTPLPARRASLVGCPSVQPVPRTGLQERARQDVADSARKLVEAAPREMAPCAAGLLSLSQARFGRATQHELARPQAAASSRSRLSYSIAAWRFHVGCVTRPIAACFGQEGAAACTAPTARADAASTRRRASRRGRARLVHVPSHPLYSHMVTRLLDGACARRPYLHWASPHSAVASKAPLPKSVVWHRAFCDAPPCSKLCQAVGYAPLRGNYSMKTCAHLNGEFI